MERNTITLEQIENREARDRQAFRNWLSHDYELNLIGPRAKESLTLYVDDLLSKIADLESDVHRPFW